MVKNNLFYIIVILLVFSCLSCKKDNFIDPNDPRYGSVDDSSSNGSKDDNKADDKEDEKDDSITEGINLVLEETFQTMHHFGASGGFQDNWVGQWPNASKTPVAVYLFSTEKDANGNPKGIGLTMWRVNIGDGSKDQSNSGFKAGSWYRETECFLSEDGTTYDWTKQAGTQWLLAKAKEYQVPYFTAWATTPPYFMTKNGYTFRTAGVSGFNCRVDKQQAYATFLAKVMKHYEDDGYNFEVVCPFNETQYNWDAVVGQASQSGTYASNAEVATVTKLIDQTFTNEGVNAKIMIPEAGQLKYLYEGSGATENQLNAFFNTSSASYIGDLSNLSTHIAAHSYFSNKTAATTVNQRTSLKNALLNYSGLDYWQTEYSLVGGDYQQGRARGDLEEIDYALWIARIIHSDIAIGNATGWDFWTALNQSRYDDHEYRFNLILYTPNSLDENHTDGTIQVVKNLWALGNYSRFVRPGMIRFNVKDSDYSEKESLDNFMISGFKTPGTKEVVLVCVNYKEEDRTLSFNGDGKSLSFTGDSFDVYTTSATENLSFSRSSASSVIIPDKSIVTLKGTLK